MGSLEAGEISNSYSLANVNGNDGYNGGLIGRIYNGSWQQTLVINTFSVGSVSGSYYTGGLIGQIEGGTITITNSFWDIQTSGTTDGIDNVDPDPSGVSGKTLIKCLSFEIVSLFSLSNIFNSPSNIGTTI